MSPDCEGVTPLIVAVYRHNIHLVELLLNHAADPTQAHVPTGYSALHVASTANLLPAVRLLLDHGAVVDARDATGSTALLVAVEGGYADVVTLLLERGADMQASKDRKSSPFMRAHRLGNLDILYRLMRLSSHHCRPQLR